jgi:hypothetical protein
MERPMNGGKRFIDASKLNTSDDVSFGDHQRQSGER